MDKVATLIADENGNLCIKSSNKYITGEEYVRLSEDKITALMRDGCRIISGKALYDGKSRICMGNKIKLKDKQITIIACGRCRVTGVTSKYKTTIDAQCGCIYISKFDGSVSGPVTKIEPIVRIAAMHNIVARVIRQPICGSQFSLRNNNNNVILYKDNYEVNVDGIDTICNKYNNIVSTERPHDENIRSTIDRWNRMLSEGHFILYSDSNKELYMSVDFSVIKEKFEHEMELAITE